MPLVASVESPPNNGNWALFKIRLGSAGSRAAESRAPCLGRMWARRQPRPDLRAREPGLAPGPGATSKFAGPAPTSAATGQLPSLKLPVSAGRPRRARYPLPVPDLGQRTSAARSLRAQTARRGRPLGGHWQEAHLQVSLSPTALGQHRQLEVVRHGRYYQAPSTSVCSHNVAHLPGARRPRIRPFDSDVQQVVCDRPSLRSARSARQRIGPRVARAFRCVRIRAEIGGRRCRS